MHAVKLPVNSKKSLKTERGVCTCTVWFIQYELFSVKVYLDYRRVYIVAIKVCFSEFNLIMAYLHSKSGSVLDNLVFIFSDCENQNLKRVRLKQGIYKRNFSVSFPRSGNDYIRSIVKQINSREFRSKEAAFEISRDSYKKSYIIYRLYNLYYISYILTKLQKTWLSDSSKEDRRASNGIKNEGRNFESKRRNFEV